MNVYPELLNDSDSMRNGRMSKKLEEDQCLTQLSKMGINSHYRFSKSLYDVLKAISSKSKIEGVDIATSIKDSQFRFYSKENPLLSLEVSNAIASVVRHSEKPQPHLSELGRRKRSENADEFAKKMYRTINDLKKKEKVSSFRETVKMLNQKGIPTSMGGQWHVNTLQILSKRWKDLGLVSSGHPAKY